MAKKSICVLFGGESTEHEVSLVSAAAVLANIDRNRYNVLPVGITKQGEWIYCPDLKPEDLNKNWQSLTRNLPATLSANRGMPGLVVFGKLTTLLQVDCVFPVLHGKNGEDGTVQGLLELSGIPFVGAGCAASCIAMDKTVTKLVVSTLGIRQADWLYILKSKLEKDMDETVLTVERRFSYPVFVKPDATGSSIGINKAKNRAGLITAINDAAEYGKKIMIEEFIDGREIEVSVLGNDNAIVSVCGEVVPAAEFYSYEAKYNDIGSKTIVPAELPFEVSEKIREYALEIYNAVGCAGMARVDFFVNRDTNEIVFNEINTIPGFTGISMYPKLMEASGIGFAALIDKLIEYAYARAGGERVG